MEDFTKMVKNKDVVGKCFYCGELIMRKQGFKTINAPYDDSFRHRSEWLVHKKCYEPAAQQLLNIAYHENKKLLSLYNENTETKKFINKRNYKHKNTKK